jgi:hypothetical protein
VRDFNVEMPGLGEEGVVLGASFSGAGFLATGAQGQGVAGQIKAEKVCEVVSLAGR